MTEKERRKLKREAKAGVMGEDRLELKQRFKNIVREVLGSASEVYAKDPNLGLVTLHEIVLNSFRTLRAVLEGHHQVTSLDPEEVPTSWTFPFVELHYPVEWGGTPLPKHSLGLEDVTDRSLSEILRAIRKKEKPFSETELGRKLLSLTESILAVGLLASMTNGVYWWTGGGERVPKYIPGRAEPPPEGASDEELEAAFKKAFSPVRVLQPGGDPGLTINGHAYGRPVKVDLALAVLPLVVDGDKEEAYFPLVVGLHFFAGEPWTWTEKEHAALWDQVFTGLTELATAIVRLEERPKPEPRPAGPELVAVAASPHRRGFPLPFGTAIVDHEATELLRYVHKVRLPGRKWSSFRSWEDLKADEVARLQEEEGDRAFRDLKRETGDRDERGPLLARRVRKDGTDLVTLTTEGELRLKLHEGLARGCRYVDPKSGKEYLVRLFQTGQGYVEVGLSWYNLAGPWTEGWRTELKATVEAERRRLQPLLFEDLERSHQERVDRVALRLQVLEDGRRIMEAILGQVGRQGRNPVRIPAVAFRTLLKLEGEPHWKSRVEGGLEALRACEFRLESYGTEKRMKGRGNLLGAWVYQGAGPGDHGEGDYFLSVVPDFLGCLAIFQSGKRKLPSGLEVTEYVFGKKLTEEEKKALGWGYDRKEKSRRKAVQRYVTFDAGRVFYHAAEGLTPEQENLVSWIEREVTLKGDGTAPGRKSLRVKRNALDAKEPRLYGSEFCPLLPGDRRFEAALGHFGHNAETGRTLFGTETRRTATGGGRPEGIIHVLGHELPPGRAVTQRRHAIQKTLEDLKAVVVDYLGGVVAAKLKDHWLSLDEVSALGRDELKASRFCLFLPETWKADRVRRWEERTGWTATEDMQEAERARELLREPRNAGPAVSTTDEVGLVGLPLRIRLHAARMERKVSLRQTGELFGVSKQAVERWERGPENKGKPIPAELFPLVLRWVETGEAPQPEELASRRTRRTGVKKAEE